MIAGILFAIQFFWQFPHFIAISWVRDKEYKKAGFKMMFGGEKGRYSALISIIFSVLMVLMTIIHFVCVLKEFNLTLISFV